MGKFNLMDLLNAQNERDTAQESGADETTRQKPGYEIAALSVYSLVPSEGNFYSIDEIEKLKRDIELAGGVKQNLTVTPLDDGKYKILAGHRRRRACLELVQEGKPEYEFIPCGIEPQQPDKEMQAIREELLIITTNSQRVKTDWDRVQETKHLHDVLQRYKAKGGTLPGRVREIIADVLDTSTGQIGRMSAIAKNLIPELQGEMREKRLGISAAYELSGLPEEQQKEAYAEYREKGGLSVSDAKQRKGGGKQKPQAAPPAPSQTPEPAPEPAPAPNHSPPAAVPSAPVERDTPEESPPEAEGQAQTDAPRPLDSQQAAADNTADNAETEVQDALPPPTLEAAEKARERLDELLAYCVTMAENDYCLGNHESDWSLDAEALLVAMAVLERWKGNV